MKRSTSSRFSAGAGHAGSLWQVRHRSNQASLGVGLNKLWSPVLRVVLPVAIATWLYSYHIRGSLYGDEWHTLDAVTAENFLGNLFSPSMSHPPLYFVAAKLGYMATGQMWGIRLPSLLFAMATVGLLPLLANKLWKGRCALVALWLTALSPFLLEFAAEGRPYAMLIFVSVAFLYALVAFIEREDPPRAWMLAAVAIMGLLTHYLFVTQLVFGACYYLLVRRKVSRYAWACAAVVAVMVLVQFSTISAHVQHVSSATKDWASADALFDAGNFLVRLPVALAFGYNTFELPALDAARNVGWKSIVANWPLVALCGVAFVGFGYAVVQAARSRDKILLLAATGIVVPAAVVVLAAERELFVAREKYLASLLGCFVLLQVIASQWLVRWRWGWLCMGCYVSVVAVSIFHFIGQPGIYSRRSDWAGLRTEVRSQSDASACVVFYHMPSSRGSRLDVVPEDVASVDVLRDKPGEVSGEHFALALDRQVAGSILLVNDEGMRHGVDPGRVYIKVLRQLRDTKVYRFGRNLSLYIFSPGRGSEHVDKHGRGVRNATG